MVKFGGNLARDACFDAPSCLVSSLWFPRVLPGVWGKLQNLSLSKVSKRVVMRFCVASVTLFNTFYVCKGVGTAYWAASVTFFLQTCRIQLHVS